MINPYIVWLAFVLSILWNLRMCFEVDSLRQENGRLKTENQGYRVRGK